MGIYWKTEWDGDATEKGHIGWIKLQSATLSSVREVVTFSGRVADRMAKVGTINDVSLTKTMDSSSMSLFMCTCLGIGTNMKIEVTRAGPSGGKQEIVYLRYEFEDALITSYDFSSQGENPTESVRINFTKVTMTLIPADKKAGEKGANPVSFNLATGVGEGLAG